MQLPSSLVSKETIDMTSYILCVVIAVLNVLCASLMMRQFYMLSNSGRSLLTQPFFKTNICMMMGNLVTAYMIIHGVE